MRTKSRGIQSRGYPRGAVSSGPLARICGPAEGSSATRRRSAAMSGAEQPMSPTVVVPAASESRRLRTAWVGEMRSFASKTPPRAMWTCAFTRPGITSLPRASSAPAASGSSAGTGAMRSMTPACTRISTSPSRNRSPSK